MTCLVALTSMAGGEVGKRSVQSIPPFRLTFDASEMTMLSM